MTHAFRALKLAICLALLSAGPAFTQTPSDEAISDTTAVAPVAYIYIQDWVTTGVDVYSVTAAGKLTLVKGSPFPVIGEMEHVNGKYLISVGNTWLHSYPIESNGALGKQVGTINTQAYGGSQCGQTNGKGSVLDHTGKYLYVSLSLPEKPDYEPGCDVLQSYQVESNGQFTYLGYVDSGNVLQGLESYPDSIPTISSNDRFAYAMEPQYQEDVGYYSFAGFRIASNGDLDALSGFASQTPETRDGSWFYYPDAVASDNAGHLAAVLYGLVEGGAPQLASYSIESNGSIKSTNTWANMPSVNMNPFGDGISDEISMSRSGQLLAVNLNPGLQIFHFNGSDPITRFSSSMLPASQVSRMAWDKNNHLYVLAADAKFMLYVYTATPASISQVPGSPISIPGSPGNMIVMPK